MFLYLYSTRKYELFMGLRLGDIAPDFEAQSTLGTIRLHEYLGDSWGVLFSHPRDFTPVCTTELGAAAKLKPEFDKRDVRMLALSVDPITDHFSWVKDIEETQNCQVNYPLLADPDRNIATLYDMIHPEISTTDTVRSVFVIAPDKRIQLTVTYPATTGRNFNEILRVIDSLQLTSRKQVATPANWNPGDEVIVALSVKEDDLETMFPQGTREVKPYLRYTNV